jgi:hypothetical protein
MCNRLILGKSEESLQLWNKYLAEQEDSLGVESSVFVDFGLFGFIDRDDGFKRPVDLPKFERTDLANAPHAIGMFGL